MKIYELQRIGLENDIDDQLKQTAADINKPKTDSGESSPPQPTSNSDESSNAPIDPGLFAAVKGHPYATNWDNNDSKISPLELMGKSVSDLTNIRNLIQRKMYGETLSNSFGLWDDPNMKFYQDAISFVEKLITYKKQHGGTESPTKAVASFQKATAPKTKAGPVKQ